MTSVSQPTAARFSQRLVAFAIDNLLLAVILFVIIDVLLHSLSGLPDAGTLMSEAQQRGNWLELVRVAMQYGALEAAIEQLIPFILTVLLWVRFGMTPGKRLCDCCIVDARHGGKPGWGQSILRYIGYIISTLTFGIGFLWMLWDKQNQALHDKIAGTRVVIVEDDMSHYSLEQLQETCA
ncbi:MAG: RDD family protein [Granulosicoccaceae bacterium]|jgi:uncharacterized RDD family membrane protein YckC